jgi:hypothetical protein
MTRLGRASALLAVFAGGYAILMLINGQPTDFDVSAGVCAVALLGAALFEYVVRLRRKTLAHGRAAVWERRDRETSTMIAYPQHFPAGWRTGIARPPGRLRRVDADGNRRCDSDPSAAASWWMHEDHIYGAGEGSHETRKVLISKGIRHV